MYVHSDAWLNLLNDPLPVPVLDVQSGLREWRRPRDNRSKPRIMLYSHDTMGLGHIRRNILLAQALTSGQLAADVLLITGAREAGRFQLPRSCDVVVLPALCKDADGAYGARHLSLPLCEIVALRSQMVLASIKSFRPDLLIVDNVVRGINGELDQALRYLRDSGGTRCVLGMRDIRDEPQAVRHEWERAHCYEALRNYYHDVWVYGDPRVYDPRSEYSLPDDIAAKVRFTGYLDQRARLQDTARTAGENNKKIKPRGRFGLCLVGGGQDGAALALAFAQAAYPDDTSGVIITGPYMEVTTRERLQAIAAMRPELRVVEFMSEPTELLRDAAFVVTMGGYNTVCEVLSFEKPALVVPRVVPRREQLIRAERLREIGVIDMLHPEQLSPQNLSVWMGKLEAGASSNARHLIDMQGLQRISEFTAANLQKPRPAAAKSLQVVS